jgi:hypothetical protein
MRLYICLQYSFKFQILLRVRGSANLPARASCNASQLFWNRSADSEARRRPRTGWKIPDGWHAYKSSCEVLQTAQFGSFRYRIDEKSVQQSAEETSVVSLWRQWERNGVLVSYQLRLEHCGGVARSECSQYALALVRSNKRRDRSGVGMAVTAPSINKLHSCVVWMVIWCCNNKKYCLNKRPDSERQRFISWKYTMNDMKKKYTLLVPLRGQ